MSDIHDLPLVMNINKFSKNGYHFNADINPIEGVKYEEYLKKSDVCGVLSALIDGIENPENWDDVLLKDAKRLIGCDEVLQRTEAGE